MNSRIALFAVCMTTLLIAGCAKYSPRPLDLPHTKAQEKNGLSVQALLLKKADTYEFFGGCCPEEKGYNTIQLTITNATNNSYSLDSSSINLELAPPHRVAEKVGFNTIGRILGWGIPGIFLWPFLIPACVDGVKSVNANEDLRYDFANRAIGRGTQCTIRPHSTLNKVLFIEQNDLQPRLEFELVNQATHVEEIFSLTLK
jgi:hypothetical protein